VLTHFQILLLDSYSTTPEHTQLPHLYPSQSLPPMQIAPSPISPNYSYPCAGIITTAFAHNPNADSATRARGTEDHTQGILAPPHSWGGQLPTPDKWGPCTPLRPLVLECELRNHPDKAFVRQLISDLTHGCNIGYTGPQFTHTAHNLQSSFANPYILDDTLHSECSNHCILGPFNAPPLYPT